MTRSPAQRLATLAASWRDGERQRVVPIIGAGVSLEAARRANAQQAVNWDGLLRAILKKSQLPPQRAKEIPAPFIHRWETLLRLYAASRPTRSRLRPYEAEEELQKEVCTLLDEIERVGQHWPLHRALVDAGFRDILSLNFDCAIAKSASRHVFRAGPSNAGADASTLYRHSVATGARGDVRIWYPHGDSRRPSTIKLGVRRYGLAIAHLEGVRRGYIATRRQHAEVDATALHPRVWNDLIRTNAKSWAEIFFTAPLCFIGCSLAPDEWPLWWLLHQRARNTALTHQRGRHDRPATVILTAGATKPHFGKAAELEQIHFRTYEALWRAVEKSLVA